MKKKLLALVLVCVLALGLMPAMSFAAGTDYTVSETISANLTDGVLTITGTGEMDVSGGAAAWPWHEDRASIVEVYVGEGITAVKGTHAFANCSNLTTVTFGSDVTTLANDTMSYCHSLTTVVFEGVITSIGQGTVYSSNAVERVIINQPATDFVKVASVKPYNTAYLNDPELAAAKEELKTELIVAPVYGHIENWPTENGETWLLASIAPYDTTVTSAAALTAGLKDGTYTLGLAITDDTTGYTYVIDEYFFDVNAGYEFGGDGWFRFAVNHYGIELSKDTTYTVEIALFNSEDGEIAFWGVSATGAWNTCNAAFAENGNLIPEVVPHTHTVVEPEPEIPEIELGKYETGIENWSNQTQLLVVAPIPVEEGMALTWDLWIEGDDGSVAWITMSPSSYYDFEDGNCLFRFETCLAGIGNDFIPVAGVNYTVSAELYDEEFNLVYTAVPGETVWFAGDGFEAIVPYTEIELGKYETGIENWSNQTQLLVMAPIPVEEGMALTWNLEIYGDDDSFEWVTMSPSSYYDFEDGNCLFRFETCLGGLMEGSFVPVAGVNYTVFAYITNAEDEVVYVATPAENTVWSAAESFEPITPITEISVAPYANGVENWSEQTQILVNAPIAEEEGNGLTWVLYIADVASEDEVFTQVTMSPSSSNPFTDYTLFRFETCLGGEGNSYIPVAGTEFVVGVEIYDGEDLVYVGYPSAIWTVPEGFEAILPEDDGTDDGKDDGTDDGKDDTTDDGKDDTTDDGNDTTDDGNDTTDDGKDDTTDDGKDDTTDDGKEESPKTGDAVVYATVAMAIALIGMVVITKKVRA